MRKEGFAWLFNSEAFNINVKISLFLDQIDLKTAFVYYLPIRGVGL